MPNWCYTAVTIKGDENEVQRFITEASKGYTIPTPTDSDTKADSLMTMQSESLEREGAISFGALTQLPSDFGINWYDRGLELWGTKWDADVDVDTILRVDGEASFVVSTAWSFPEEGIIIWSKAFPELSFSGTVREESEAYAGAFTVKAGKMDGRFYDPWTEVENLGSSPSEEDEDADIHAWQEYWDEVNDTLEKMNQELLATLIT